MDAADNKSNAAAAAAAATAPSAGSCDHHHHHHQQQQRTDDVCGQKCVSPSSETKGGRRHARRLLRRAGRAFCDAVVPAAVLLSVAYSFVQTARLARDDRPRDLAFAAFAYADLAALLWCLRRAERLAAPPGSSPPAGEDEEGQRRRLRLAVWALSTALSCAFAYRVSLMMPAAMVAVVWSMTLLVVLLGFYLLVVCRDERRGYGALEVDGDAHAGDGGKGLGKKIGAADEMV